MTTSALLEEVRRCGAIVYRTGDCLRVRPASAIPPDLVARLCTHKAELLQLLPDYDAIPEEITADICTAEGAAAIEWYVSLNGDAIVGEVTALERRCERLACVGNDETAYRAAVTVLVARMQQIRTWYRAASSNERAPDAPRPRWRLTVGVNHPVPGPIRLDDGTEITEVPRFVAQTCTAIDYVLQQPPRSYPDGAALIRVYIKQLELVGVVARVEAVQ